ncbi:beta-2-syntrophin-like [Acanthaster planci]|uniref:Beta-2-syntrophin-like n=1 Tax=Acanthaster planci TaxID=133434 RepID=A0A8B7ZW03_ACAPL|nr:beta-2-syntrophin-like [Acanthaster planci]
MTDHYVSMAQIRASKKLKNESLSTQETAFEQEEPYAEMSFTNTDDGQSEEGDDAPSGSGASWSTFGESAEERSGEEGYVTYMPQTRKVVLHPGNAGLGMSIVGGVKGPNGLLPVVITDIDPGGEVEKSTLVKVGDRIVSVNGVSMDGKTHRDVVLAIRAAGSSLVMEVQEEQGDILDYIWQNVSDD